MDWVDGLRLCLRNILPAGILGRTKKKLVSDNRYLCDNALPHFARIQSLRRTRPLGTSSLSNLHTNGFPEYNKVSAFLTLPAHDHGPGFDFPLDKRVHET